MTKPDISKFLALLDTRATPAEHLAEGPDVARVRGLAERPSISDDERDAMSRYFRVRPEDGRCPDHDPDDCKLCGNTGHIRLREHQATALREIWHMRGLLGPMRVGSGKTLVTLLAATLLDAQRPVLIVPASLRDKTHRDFAVLRKAWRVRLPSIITYEELGQPEPKKNPSKWALRRLLELQPDLIIQDEAHKSRNRDAACSRRIRRYIEDNPTTANVILSGTLITGDICDYHHHALWALGDSAPVPKRRADAERWAAALGGSKLRLKKIGLGALGTLPGGFHQHLRSRRGVVPTPGSDCDASIELSWWQPTLPGPLQDIIRRVIYSNMRPDGELLEEFDLVDCIAQLALGFYYIWDPLPPEWWLTPRRAWAKYVRDVLDEHIDGYDSPSQIVNALDAPLIPGVERRVPPDARRGAAAIDNWREVRDLFDPNTVPVWLTYDVVDQALTHAKPGTLIWTRYQAVGSAFAERGVPYFGGGTNPEPCKASDTLAMSIAAHGTGKNLQKWHRNLVLTPPANAAQWEQLIGRTHRAGQKSDTVYVEIIDAVPYHRDVMRRVQAESRRDSEASGFGQKLTEGSWV